MKPLKNKHTNVPKEDKISRKEAIKKAGTYAAFAATGMLVLLNPKKSQAQSPNDPARPPAW